MKLLLRHQKDEIATLACDETKAWIVTAHQAFKKSIADRIQRGIDFPEGIVAAQFNFKPGTISGEEQLKRIGGLYQLMYKMEVTLTAD